MESVLLQSVWALGLPASVALGAVALLGYIFGQRTRAVASDQMQMRRELKRARGIIRDLERVAQQVRRDLASHQGSLGKFRTRLRDICEAGEQEPIDLLACEAGKLLEPTQHLTVKLAQAYELIRQQANQLTSFSEVRTDEPTGLANRHALDEMLSNQLGMHRRYKMICSVVMVEIDRGVGTEADESESRGDHALTQVGQLFDQYARESDLICRYGGEEIVAVLAGTGLAGAVAFAERMRAMIEKLSLVTVSCGVAEMNAQDDETSLLARADAALYSAKAAGRNRVFEHTGRKVSCATPPPPLAASTHDRRHDAAVRETIREVATSLNAGRRIISPGNSNAGGEGSIAKAPSSELVAG